MGLNRKGVTSHNESGKEEGQLLSRALSDGHSLCIQRLLYYSGHIMITRITRMDF